MTSGEKFKTPGLQWVESLSIILDSKFTFPGTKFKFGIDPILGLFPVIGDLTTFAISSALILYMMKHGVSRKVVILMMGNVIIDTLLGAIPLLGNIFDFTFRANNRNIKLLRKHYEEGKYQGSGNGILIVTGLGLIAITGIVIYTLIALGVFLLNLLSSIFL